MNITTIDLIVIILSLIAMVFVKPIVRWFMRDKYKTYKDVFGNAVVIKTNGYIRGGG